jgi:hypothetical protein
LQAGTTTPWLALLSYRPMLAAAIAVRGPLPMNITFFHTGEDMSEEEASELLVSMMMTQDGLSLINYVVDVRSHLHSGISIWDG